MTAPMDQASELMLWSDEHRAPHHVVYGTRDLGESLRTVMTHAFGIDWDKRDRLRAEQDMVGIAEKVSTPPGYEIYMTSLQVREHMEDQAFDAISVYDMVPVTQEGMSFCGPWKFTEWWPRDLVPQTYEQRIFAETSVFGPLSPIEPVSAFAPGSGPAEPRRFKYPVC
jgi:hypothetical protein